MPSERPKGIEFLSSRLMVSEEYKGIDLPPIKQELDRESQGSRRKLLGGAAVVSVLAGATAISFSNDPRVQATGIALAFGPPLVGIGKVAIDNLRGRGSSE